MHLSDYLATIYQNDGDNYRLTQSSKELGHLHVAQGDFGLEIILLFILPGAEDRGLCLRTFHTLIEAADRFRCPLLIYALPLPFVGCAIGLIELETLGFHWQTSERKMLERIPISRVLLAPPTLAA